MSEFKNLDVSEIAVPEGERSRLEALDQLAAHEETVAILVYGSSARHEIVSSSDLDSLALVKGDIDLPPNWKVRVSSSLPTLLEFLDGRVGDLTVPRIVDTEGYEQMVFNRLSRKHPAAKYVVPWRLRHNRIHAEAVAIYGDKPKQDSDELPEVWLRELAKSLLTRLLFAVAVWPFVYFTSSGNRWVVNAYKWTILNCGYLLDQANLQISECLEELPLILRKEIVSDRKQTNTANPGQLVVAVLAIHLWTACQLTRRNVHMQICWCSDN
jgi:hypothetical protein